MANKIKGLTRAKSFEEAAFIILRYRFNNIKKKVKIYFNIPSVENLHDLRISVRRLRYSMENFELFYKKREFNKMIEYLKHLQDLIGEGRDLDVFEDKIKQLARENEIEISEFLYQIIEDRKVESTHNIKVELMKLLKDKEIKNFFGHKS